MSLSYLDHVNLRTTRLSELCTFYCDVLGLCRGPRPAFPFGGAWLYCGDRPVVHLVEVANAPERAGDLSLQHFAFRGQGLSQMLDSLRRAGIAPRVSVVADFGICQLNLADPDGNHLHLDYPLAEAARAGLV